MILGPLRGKGLGVVPCEDLFLFLYKYNVLLTSRNSAKVYHAWCLSVYAGVYMYMRVYVCICGCVRVCILGFFIEGLQPRQPHRVTAGFHKFKSYKVAQLKHLTFNYIQKNN